MQAGVQPGVQPGEVLAGKYRVESVLGVGGMGVVVAAYHLQLDERVALKFLRPEALGNAEATARFLREARAAAKIKSEYVARVSDVGTLANGAPYIVMEYLQGGDLAAWLQQRGPLPLEQAVEFLLQAGVAVAEAHSLGIVHRDLKPANLFCVVRADGRPAVKVLDFGISKMMDRAGTSEPPGLSVTKTATSVGSPLYMSPEQVRNAKDVDARTDVWALGVILFELLTGRTPFHGETFGDLAVKIAVEPPASLRTYRPDLSPELEGVIAQCLEKDRTRRCQSVAQLASALVPFAPPRARPLVERIRGTQQAGSSPSAPPGPAAATGRNTGGWGPGSGTVSVQGSVAGWSGPPPAGGAAGKNGKKVAAVVACLVTLLFGGAAALTWPRSPKTAPSAGATVTAPPTAPSAPPLESSAAVELPPPSEPSALPPADSAAQEPEPAQARPAPAPAKAPPLSAPHPSASAASRPRSAPLKPDCDPPYTLDDQGRKKFKTECFLTPTP